VTENCLCLVSECGSADVTGAAGEMLSVAGPFLEQQMHPTVIIGAFRQALDDLLTVLKDQVSIAVDIANREEMTRIIKSCIGTKFITKWSAPVVHCSYSLHMAHMESSSVDLIVAHVSTFALHVPMSVRP